MSAVTVNLKLINAQNALNITLKPARTKTDFQFAKNAKEIAKNATKVCLNVPIVTINFI